MKLFLASEAKNPPTVKKLEEILGGFVGKKVAYIPTAANGEGYGAWKEGGSWSLVQTLGWDIKLVELEQYYATNPLPDIASADVIWVAGGQPGYLMYWMRRTRLDKFVNGLLDKGALYVGSSAGSMVASPTLSVTDWYIGENEYGASIIPGLGLVDFDIYPHFRDELLPKIKRLYKGNKLYLLKDGEEIIVQNGIATVIGEERIISSVR